MQELLAAIDNLRRETRHDLRDLRAGLAGLAETFQETSTRSEVNHTRIIHLEQQLSSLEIRCAKVRGEIDDLEERVNTLEKTEQRVVGGWRTIVVIAGVVAFAIGYTVKIL